MASKKRRWKRIAAWTILAVFAFAVFDYWTFPLLAHRAEGRFDRGSNGLWLRYTWYFGEHSPEEVRELGRRLEENHIRYAYFHVRDIKPDGSLRYPHLAETQALNRQLADANPSVKRIAWIYVGNTKGRGAVDLNDAKVRERLVAEAGRLLKQGGFQGIQWDYEICDDGEPGQPALLDDSRRLLPPCWLGVAAPAWYPWPLTGVSWSEGYFRDLAQRCDQIAVMAYDSGMYHPRLYSYLVAQQANVLERVTSGTGCRFVIGAPTYGDPTLSHNPRSENLALALAAVKNALASSECRRCEGVALFADYTTSPEEWDTFRRDWLIPGIPLVNRLLGD